MAGRNRVVHQLACGMAAYAMLAAPAVAAETRTWVTPGCVVAVAGARGAVGSVSAGLIQSRVEPIARISSGVALDGSAFVHAVAEDLDVMKKVSRSGAYTLRLQRGSDAVVIRADRDSVTVSRGGEAVRVVLESAGEEDLAAVRVLLVGSRSVRGLRVLGAGLGAGAVRSPGGLALVLADAFVGLLDGDVTAVHRLAERLASGRPAARRVSSPEGCYERWEGEVIRAWDDYEGCLAVYPSIGLWRDACGVRWIMWAESAWFSFLTCAGSPFKTS